MKTIGPDKTYIDYFQTVCALNGLNLFGIRVAERRCSVVVKTGDGPPNTYSKHYALPVELQTLPNHVRRIVEDHLWSYPGSDLADVLAGEKTFHEALESPAVMKEEPMRTANGDQRPANAS